MKNRARQGSCDDTRFIQRLSDAYAPEPMDSVARGAFDARLRARLEVRRRWWPAIAATAAACSLLLLLARSAPRPASSPAVRPASATAVAATRGGTSEGYPSREWAHALFYADAYLARDRQISLPEEFVAISYAFLE